MKIKDAACVFAFSAFSFFGAMFFGGISTFLGL